MADLLTSALLPIFFVLALGYVAGMVGKIDNRELVSLNTVVVDFALPAAMFGAVAKASRSELLRQRLLFLVLAIGLLILWLSIYFLARKVLGRGQAASALLAITISSPNAAAAGIPLMNAIFGAAGQVPTVVGIAMPAIVLVPPTLIMVDLARAREDGGGESPGKAIVKAVRRSALSPLILAPVIAAALVLSGVHVPRPIDMSFQLLGQASGAVALLLTGLVLSVEHPRWSFGILAAVLLVNLGHPALSLLIARLLHAAPRSTHEAVLLSALPAGFFGLLFALRFGEDAGESGSIVALSTVFSAATLCAVIVATRHMG